ncbi:MAG: hypothetical protein K2P94_06405 [Rhodospirillaceae bacterium]|nr:hypothetical protein [Rhodospirillaceae bacterium]
MDENLRTWLWFISVVTAMTLGPIVVGSFAVYMIVLAYRRYRGLICEKLRTARVFHAGH